MSVPAEASTGDPVARGWTLRTWLLLGGLVFATALLGVTATRSGNLAALWLPDGVLLAALLRLERRQWPFCLGLGLAAYIVANLISGTPLGMSLVMPLCNLIGVLAGAWPLHRRWGSRLDLRRLRPLLEFLVLAGVLAPALSGAVGALVLWAAIGIRPVMVWQTWYPAVAGGILVMAPLILAPSGKAIDDFAPALGRPRNLPPLLLLLLVLALTFGQSGMPVLFTILPVLLLIVFRVGFVGAVLGLFVTALVAVAATGAGYGAMVGMAPGRPSLQAVILQVFLLVNVLTVLPTAAMLAERDRLERDLRRANQRAEAANRAKSDFLASMSHELRTPLNAIIGFAQLLTIGRDPLTARQRDCADYILRGGNQLFELVKDVLDFAKIESGELRISIETVDIGELLSEFDGTIGPMAAARDLTLTLQHRAGASRLVRADRTRLMQVLLNLASNAVKYNRPGGQVTVESSAAADGWLRVTVVDTGIGIALNRQKEVFQPFNRLGAESGPIEGTGIGLSICQNLITLMQGRIGFDSEPDRGSRFWIELPPAADDADGAGPALADLDPPAPGAAAIPHLDLLYIDDNPASLALMKAIVGTLPEVRLLVAPTGDIGLAMARGHRPDLILVDIHLPDMDGFQLLARLKAVPETAGLTVIALTADALPREIERGRQAGFADYLTKPLQVARLCELIDVARAGKTGLPAD